MALKGTMAACYAVEAIAGVALVAFPLLGPLPLPQWRIQARPQVLVVVASEGAPGRAPGHAQKNTSSDSRSVTLPGSPARLPAGTNSDVSSDLAPPNAVADGSFIYSPAGLFAAGPVASPVLARPEAASRPALRSSSVTAASLLYRVQPEYPSIARELHLEGQVLLRARISRFGLVENLAPVSGPPILVSAAVNAVRQWRYRPYVLNGEAVEVETEITVSFTLARN